MKCSLFLTLAHISLHNYIGLSATPLFILFLLERDTLLALELAVLVRLAIELRLDEGIADIGSDVDQYRVVVQ
jgi:hypothetical protein